MIGHQAPAPHLDTKLAATLAQKVAVKRVIVLGKEHRLAMIAALGHMMGKPGNDRSGNAHGREASG